MSGRPRPTRVVVLFGGPNTEHTVSVSSATTVVRNLDRVRYTVTPIRITPEGHWSPGHDAPVMRIDEVTLRLMTPEPEVPSESFFRAINVICEADVVLPVLHGPYNQNGTVQSVLDYLGVPYVGSGALAVTITMDRDLTRRLLAGDGIAFTPGEDDRASAAAGPGREVSVGVLEMPDGRLLAGPPLETRIGEGHARYRRSLTDHIVPADLGPATAERIGEESMRVFRTLGCAGMLRVDFLVGPGGELIVNGVKPTPELTALARFPRIWRAAGLPYPELLDLLIRTARRRATRLSSPAHGAS